jgi:hypothetical protein
MQCEKASYSKDKAKRMVKGISINGKEMRAYQCNICFRWHLTSDVQAKGKWANEIVRK